MTDTARVLLTASVLSALAFSILAWRVLREDVEQPARLIGELRLAQWAAILLSVSGAVPIGFAITMPAPSMAHVDATIGIIFVIVAGLVMQREPREALLLAALGFGVHALWDIAHRPGWLATDLAPRWYNTGSAVLDVYLAACCYGARRR